MNTVWLDHMEEEELNAFLLEEQMIMNQQLQQLPQTNDVPRSQVVLNTITTTTTTTTRAEDIISWLDMDDDVYIPALPAAAAAQEIFQENIFSNLQMDHHQVEEEEEVLVLDNNNNNSNHEDQTLFMNFDHQYPDNPDYFPVPESPLLLDLLCNINDFDISPSHHHHHQHQVVEEIPPDTNYHQSLSSCSSPVPQNHFFDDPDESEFTLINDDNHDTTTHLVINTSTTTTRDHIYNNEYDHNSSHGDDENVNNLSTMINKVIINATDGAAIDQAGDDHEDNQQGEMDAEGHGDGDDPNYKPIIISNTSTSSSSLAASATATACKNLVSERNRRKRLSQQLLALRSLVPNITKMDKRSVLVDALAYLRRIHEETTRLQNELKQPVPPSQSNTMSSSTTTTTTTTTGTTTTTTLTLSDHEGMNCPDNLSGNLCIPRMLARTKPRGAIITEIDTEKIENQRFVVKITCKVKGGSSSSTGVGGDVLRVMESLGFDITYTTITTLPPHHHQTPKPQNKQVLTTLFIKVRNNKHGKMTEEKLRECISNRALRCGLVFQKPMQKPM